MAEIINALNQLLRTVQEMAGGRIKGQIAFWIVIILVAAIGISPAYNSVSDVVDKLNISSPITNAIASMLFVLTGFVVLFAILTLIGALFGTVLRSAIDTAFRIRLNDTFNGLLAQLQTAKTLKPDDIEISRLLKETEELYYKWRATRTNVFMQWIFPKYFKRVKPSGT